jgi:ubiquinone/menaquinone biosynthesis C-methylase UbiE
MSFDRLAPHYRWMEWLLAGGKLQRCRTAFVDSLPPVRHALLLGEGNGRFLREFLMRQPDARVTCLDASARMLHAARRNLHASERVNFVCCDVAEWNPPRSAFDLVVSNFFLDCFQPEQIDRIAGKISDALRDDGCWLVADFCEPPQGWRKWRARVILQTMYWFFQRTTDLPARKLTAPEGILRRRGLELRARRTFEWGLLHSDLWVRAPETTGLHEQFSLTVCAPGLPCLAPEFQGLTTKNYGS